MHVLDQSGEKGGHGEWRSGRALETLDHGCASLFSRSRLASSRRGTRSRGGATKVPAVPAPGTAAHHACSCPHRLKTSRFSKSWTARKKRRGADEWRVRRNGRPEEAECGCLCSRRRPLCHGGSVAWNGSWIACGVHACREWRSQSGELDCPMSCAPTLRGPARAGGPDVSRPALHWATRRWSAKPLQDRSQPSSLSRRLAAFSCCGSKSYSAIVDRRTICAALSVCPAALSSGPSLCASAALHACRSLLRPRFLPGLASSRSPFSSNLRLNAHRRQRLL